MARIQRVDRLLRLPKDLDDHLNIIGKVWNLTAAFSLESQAIADKINFNVHFRVATDWMAKLTIFVHSVKVYTCK